MAIRDLSSTSPAAWSSGAYVYGIDNITKIGSAWFTYDKVNRLTAGNLYTAPLGGGTATQQGYTYDPFGKLTAITGDRARNTLTMAATNRLTTGTYDAAGNLTIWNGATYQYDRFNQMVRMTSGSQDWAYVYTADDERIWSYDLAEQEPYRWTLRDLSGQVLREYLNDDGLWTVGTDYIRRDGQLLAAETRLGRRHFHLDHLGTPRLITSLGAPASCRPLLSLPVRKPARMPALPATGAGVPPFPICSKPVIAGPRTRVI